MAGQADFTIVGAGLAGPLMACYLGRAGYRVDVYEKRPDPRGGRADRGRSINLALSVRGLHALREVDLAEPVLETAVRMSGRMIHPPNGKPTFQPYGKDENESLFSVSRAGLNRILLEAAAAQGGTRLFFGQKCSGIDLHTAALELTHEDTGGIARVPCQTVLAADGAFSVVRAQMQRQDRFSYQQDFLSHGYKELSISPWPGGLFKMEPHALHIWPRHSFMLIALPNQDGSFTCTLFLPFEGPNSFAQLLTPADVQRFFQQQFPDALALMPGLVEEFFANPTGSLVTIRCSPWHVADRVLLLGDACHAVVPFLGQGMNAAFEDCTVLQQCLKQHPGDRTAAFRAFEEQRKVHMDTLADLCVDNFLEMRDRVSSRAFLLKKKFQMLLHKLAPGYTPLYTLISFTTTPYAEAVQRAQGQDRLLAAILGALVLVLLAFLLFLVRR